VALRRLREIDRLPSLGALSRWWAQCPFTARLGSLLPLLFDELLYL
jgi:hypothetical protein